MPGTPDGPQAREPAPETLRVRIEILVLLVVLLHAWLLTHTGIDIPKLAAVDAAAAVVAHLIPLLRKRQAAALREAARDTVTWLARPRVLAEIAVAFAVVGSFWSTGIVFPVTNIADVALSTNGWPCVEERHLRSPGAEWRFHCFTTPFGRGVGVNASVDRAYQSYSVNLYPWIPRMIRVTTQPTILVRVPEEHFEAAEGATIEIRNGTDLLVGKRTSAREAAVLVGPRREIPQLLKDKWKRDLEAVREPSETIAVRINAWEVSDVVRLPRPIEAGMHLRVLLLGPERNKLAETADYAVTPEPLQEIVMFSLRRQ
jgi:hypothetical protein